MGLIIVGIVKIALELEHGQKFCLLRWRRGRRLTFFDFGGKFEESTVLGL